jgi:hypothetical protein
MRRTVQVAAGVAAMLVFAPSGHSKPRRHAKADGSPACMDAYRAAEKQEQENHLREARDMLAACAKTSCGKFLHHQCTHQRKRLDKLIPTILPRVTDAAGASLTDVQVIMDGEVLTARIGKKALRVDPGVHDFVFKAANGRAVTQKIVIAPGQHNRHVSVSLTGEVKDDLAALPGAPSSPATTKADVFDAPVSPPEPRAASQAAAGEAVVSEDPPRRDGGSSTRSSSSVGPYLLGGLGLAGLGGYALLTSWGRKDNDALAECSPRCPPETVTHIRRIYLAADVSAAVGVAALIGSATWFIVRSGSSNKEQAANHPPYLLDVKPTPSGALATVSGAF